MIMPYQEEINKLYKWIENVNNSIGRFPLQLTKVDVQKIERWIYVIAENIDDEYSFYNVELPRIANILFVINPYGAIDINLAAFGELFIIIKQIRHEPKNSQFWKSIHPRIANISQGLYCDGHFASAAEKALKEIETKLREMFQELKPGVTVPSKVLDVMRALLSENGIYHYCDTTTVSGKNYCKGVCALFEGAFVAYRNPASHANLTYTKREAIEQITLASQLMYILTEPKV